MKRNDESEPDNSIPLDTPRLLDYLKTKFPNRCARKAMTDREVWIEAGWQEVISLIELRLEQDSAPPE